MNFIDITDINLPELNIYHQFRDNAFTADNSFVADSPKVVNLLLETDITVRSILATQEYYDTYEHLIRKKHIPKLFVASKALMQEMSKELGINTLGHPSRVLVFVISDVSMGDTVGLKVDLELGEYVLRKGNTQRKCLFIYYYILYYSLTTSFVIICLSMNNNNYY